MGAGEGLHPAGRAARSCPGWVSWWHHPAPSQCLGKQEIPQKASQAFSFLADEDRSLPLAGEPAAAPTLRRPQGNPGEDCGCPWPHLAASPPAGCSISRSASSSSTSAGSTGEAASFTGESLQTASMPRFLGGKGSLPGEVREGGRVPGARRGCARLAGLGGGGGIPKSILGVEHHSWRGGRGDEERRQGNGMAHAPKPERPEMDRAGDTGKRPAWGHQVGRAHPVPPDATGTSSATAPMRLHPLPTAGQASPALGGGAPWASLVVGLPWR